MVIRADQQVLNFILASVSKKILVYIATAKTATDTWKTLQEQLTSQTRPRAINMWVALATTPEGNLSVTK
jgi:hypothetical protein